MYANAQHSNNFLWLIQQYWRQKKEKKIKPSIIQTTNVFNMVHVSMKAERSRTSQLVMSYMVLKVAVFLSACR